MSYLQETDLKNITDDEIEYIKKSLKLFNQCRFMYYNFHEIPSIVKIIIKKFKYNYQYFLHINTNNIKFHLQTFPINYNLTEEDLQNISILSINIIKKLRLNTELGIYQFENEIIKHNYKLDDCMICYENTITKTNCCNQNICIKCYHKCFICPMCRAKSKFQKKLKY